MKMKRWYKLFNKYITGDGGTDGSCFCYEIVVLGNDEGIMNDAQYIMTEPLSYNSHTDTSLALTQDETIVNSELEITLSIDILKLIDMIEVEHKSDLKTFMGYRILCKILEDGKHFLHWHKVTKDEMGRLRQFISKEELKCYMKYCTSIFVSNKSEHNKLRGTNLHMLLHQRELLRNDKELLRFHQKKIAQEWHNLLHIMPLETSISYALEIIEEIMNEKRNLR